MIGCTNAICKEYQSSTDESDYSRKVAGVIRSLVNARRLELELLVPDLMYGSEIIIWREKERSRIRAVQIDLRGLVGIRRMWFVRGMHVV